MAKLTYYERKAVKNSIFLPVGFSTLSKKEKQRHLNGRCCSCGGKTPVDFHYDGDYDGRVIGVSFDLLCDGCQDACHLELTKDGWQPIQLEAPYPPSEGKECFPF